MTEHKIRFSIGSDFTGEGFKQAQGAVNNLNSGIKKSAAAIGAIAGAVGTMDTKFSKVASGVSGLINALASGNPYIAATTVAMTALSFAMGSVKQSIEEQKKKIKELNEANAKLVKESGQATKEWTSNFIKETDKQEQRLNSLISQYEKLTKVMNSIEINQISQQSSELNLTRIQALATADSPEMKDVINAFYDLQDTIIKINESATKFQQDIDEAQSAYTQSIRVSKQIQDNINKTKENIQSIEQEIADTEYDLSMLNENNKTMREAYNSKLKDLNSALDAECEQLEKYSAERKEQEVKIIAAKKGVENAEIQSQTNLLENEAKRLNAEKALTESLEKIKDASYERLKSEYAIIDKQNEQLKKIEKMSFEADMRIKTYKNQREYLLLDIEMAKKRLEMENAIANEKFAASKKVIQSEYNAVLLKMENNKYSKQLSDNMQILNQEIVRETENAKKMIAQKEQILKTYTEIQQSYQKHKEEFEKLSEEEKKTRIDLLETINEEAGKLKAISEQTVKLNVEALEQSKKIVELKSQYNEQYAKQQILEKDYEAQTIQADQQLIDAKNELADALRRQIEEANQTLFGGAFDPFSGQFGGGGGSGGSMNNGGYTYSGAQWGDNGRNKNNFKGASGYSGGFFGLDPTDIGKAAYNSALNAGASAKEADRARKDAERAARTGKSDAHKYARDEQKLEELNNKEKLSESEQKLRDQLQKAKDARDAEKKKLQDAIDLLNDNDGENPDKDDGKKPKKDKKEDSVAAGGGSGNTIGDLYKLLNKFFDGKKITELLVQ